MHDLRNNLPFLPERMKIQKVEKLEVNLHDKKEYVIHMKNLKRALYHGLVLKKVQRVIKFNQKAWLKTYTGMNTKLKKKAKNDFEKNFSTSWIMQFLEKLWKIWENRDIELVNTEVRNNYLMSDITKAFQTFY